MAAGRGCSNVGNVTMDLVSSTSSLPRSAAPTPLRSTTSGTDVKQVASTCLDADGGQGDGAADTVIVNGTAGDDQIGVVSSGSSIVVNGLSAQVTINGVEPERLARHQRACR